MLPIMGVKNQRGMDIDNLHPAVGSQLLRCGEFRLISHFPSGVWEVLEKGWDRMLVHGCGIRGTYVIRIQWEQLWQGDGRHGLYNKRPVMPRRVLPPSHCSWQTMRWKSSHQANKEMGEALQRWPQRRALCHPGLFLPQVQGGKESGRTKSFHSEPHELPAPCWLVEWGEQLNITGDQSLQIKRSES